MNNNDKINEISFLKKAPINNCNNCCPRSNLRYCCEVLTENITCVPIPICSNTPVKSDEFVHAKIIKKCAGKILIEGLLHKIIRYAACINPNHTIVKKVPFSCFIDVDETLDTDIYEIVGSAVICNYTKLELVKTCNGNKWVMKEKDIIKIAVQRIER